MITFEGLDRNFQFLVLEVRRQLESTRRVLKAPSDALVRKVLSRDNYTDTLKSLIEKKYISYFRHSPDIDKTSANIASAINIATINLERIADFCVNIAHQVDKTENRDILSQVDFEPYFKELQSTTPLIVDALSNADTTVALKICRTESTLDQLYKADFIRIRDGLSTGQDTDDLLCCLYIVHYLERMGDSLLNIGEAALFAATGEKLKLHEYQQLREALTAQDSNTSVEAYDVQFKWETRSGCRIAKVEEKDGEPEAIFKKGELSKIKSERENISRWESLMPGIAPRVLEYRENGSAAALLLSFLNGFTIRDLALNGESAKLDSSLSALARTLEKTWMLSRTGEKARPGFLRQLQSRLDDVFRLHPGFSGEHYDIGSLEVSSLEELIAAGAYLDESVCAPFSVLVHGDFNADNIIYDEEQDRIHFIDLYRSGISDYVQDVSVFLVSNFRVSVMASDVRALLDRAALCIFDFARDFAQRQHDETFELRLALGLARSLITSTRFETDRIFARRMFLRGLYLLRKVIHSRDQSPAQFRINREIIVN